MEDGIMQIYSPPTEHIGMTWFVCVSPILLVLAIAYINQLKKNPPKWWKELNNWVIKKRRFDLYVQSLELRLEQAEAKLAARDDQEAETIPFEEMTMYEQFKYKEKEALRPKYTYEQRQQMRGEEVENAIEL